jgi:hypothetical protein
VNAKRAKKLRWYARTQEAMMPDPMINEAGIPSTLLVFNHPKVWKDAEGVEHTFTNRTIQYNPRTSGKGFYKALKGGNANIRGTIPYVRFMCQQRIVRLLAARSGGMYNPPAGPASGPTGSVAVAGDGPARTEDGLQ